MSVDANLVFCVFLAFLRQTLQLSCSSEPKCRCYFERGMLSADCSSLNLICSPRFNQNVRCIFLNKNRLTEIPTDMPQEIVKLDISDNNIRNPKKVVLSRYRHLQWININYNCLWAGYKEWPSRFFENLKKLNTLLMNDKCFKEFPDSRLRDMKYSNGSFYGLSSLRHIELNGLGGHNFVDAFEQNNSVEVLVLSIQSGRCFLKSIENDTFYVFKQLKKLTLLNCEIKYIEKGAFRHLHDLVYLDVSENRDLTLSVLPNITYDLQYTKIHTFSANSLQCRNGLSLLLRISHIEYLRNTLLIELSLGDNRIGIIEHRLTEYLPKSLTYINIKNNPLIYGDYIFEGDFLPNLERLDSDRTNKETFHELGCNYNSNSCNKEKEITIEETEYKESPPFNFYQLPPKLKSLSIANQKIFLPLIDNAYGFRSKNSLKHLHVQGNLIYDIQYFSGLWRLEYVDLSNNFCFNITKQSFRNMSNLLFLNLSRNLLGKELKRQSAEHVFDHLHGLKVLDLSYNWINLLYKDVFVSLSNIEHLNLSNNELGSVAFDLSAALKLRSIDLSSNKIVMLDSKAMDFLDALRDNQLSIQMSNNPLQCTCQSLKFLKWMKASLNKHFVGRDDYTCTFTTGKKIELRHLDQIITSLERQCTSFTTTIVIVTIILLVTILLISFAIMYRYRWKLRYLYYAGKRSYRGYSRVLDSGREYQFDAFISYAESERTEFIPNLLKLERENNFKFCIHSRDFIIGVNVAENITNAIHNSKRTVCFLSKAFLQSEFCTYEAQMARMESIYRGGETTLFNVLVDQDLGAVLPQFLKDVIREQTYLEYDKEVPEEFWNAITQALREI